MYPDFENSQAHADESVEDNIDEIDESDDQLIERDIEQQTIERPQLVSSRRLRRDIVETVLLVVVIYTLVNLTTARAIVEGPSMQPNFYTGQLVVINRFAYFFAEPQRGDVIVLHNPRSDCQDPSRVEEQGCEDLIKRVIGLPGETVEIKQGRVSVNGMLLDESYVQDYCRNNCDGRWPLDSNHYFILGDNRNNSYDSHSFGPIPRSLIMGQAWIRYWPPQDAKIIPHPNYEPETGK